MSEPDPVPEEAEEEQLNKAIEDLRGVLHDGRAGEDGALGAGGGLRNPGIIMDIPVEIQIVLGSAEMPVSELMGLQKGSTVRLNRRIGEPVEVVVNGRRIARGEITVLDNDPSRFGVRLTEVAGATTKD